MSEKITAILMIEMLGRPAEHIKQAIEELVEKLGKEKDVKVNEKTIADAKPLPEEENLFSIFAEVEIETGMENLMMIIFAYMPSHIDIVSPEELRVKNTNLNIFFNELTRRLHQYDELTKALVLQLKALENKFKEQIAKKEGQTNEKPEKLGENKKEKKT